MNMNYPPELADLVRADEKKTPNFDNPWSIWPHYKETDGFEMASARHEFALNEDREWRRDIRAANYDNDKARARKIARDYPELCRAAWEKQCREATLWGKIRSRLIGNFCPIPLKPEETVPVWLAALLINLIMVVGTTVGTIIVSFAIGYFFAIIAAVVFLVFGAIWARIAGS